MHPGVAASVKSTSTDEGQVKAEGKGGVVKGLAQARVEERMESVAKAQQRELM